MIPWRREWQPTPVFLPESPWGFRESDITEWLIHIHDHWLKWLIETIHFVFLCYLKEEISKREERVKKKTLTFLWGRSLIPVVICIFFGQGYCSVTQLRPTPCDPMDCSPPGFLALHCLWEVAQARVHWVSDAIQPSHPLSSPSPPALNLSQHQGLF